MSFDPNKSTLSACLSEIRKIQEDIGLDTSRIITSRDEVIRKNSKLFEVRNVPEGFKKVRLPLHLRNESTLYISTGAPDTKVPRHSHDEGDGIRFMISGSIQYGDKELTAGDWMFIPAGAEYEFVVGPYGATMCYCYCCCCA
jgi:quercetin dioxygenase-like cupin family protein